MNSRGWDPLKFIKNNCPMSIRAYNFLNLIRRWGRTSIRPMGVVILQELVRRYRVWRVVPGPEVLQGLRDAKKNARGVDVKVWKPSGVSI